MLEDQRCLQKEMVVYLSFLCLVALLLLLCCVYAGWVKKRRKWTNADHAACGAWRRALYRQPAATATVAPALQPQPAPQVQFDTQLLLQAKGRERGDDGRARRSETPVAATRPTAAVVTAAAQQLQVGGRSTDDSLMAEILSIKQQLRDQPGKDRDHDAMVAELAQIKQRLLGLDKVEKDLQAKVCWLCGLFLCSSLTCARVCMCVSVY